MSKFIAYSESGVTINLNAKTELGAKREATKWLSYRFGWSNWEQIPSNKYLYNY